ncbi:MAG TPA: class I SAM-dependent methyltransferase [Rhizobiales bacterium]|nr:class I SAM-dependent methyltransferase [Hyphomicrobiales bacterium]
MPGFYEHRIVPRLINLACASSAIEHQRKLVVPQAHGVVLEAGIGSGLNLPFYDKSRVRTIIGVDPGKGILELGRERFEKSPIPVEIINQSAEDIPLETNSADTVLLTWSACSIPDIKTALGEMRRVLKPGGQLIFCEHGKSPDAHIAWRQNLLNKVWPKLAGGCNLNRDIPALLTGAGFKIKTLDGFYAMKAAKSLTWHFRGLAEPA